jgi:Bacterial Ig-like domain (group 2)
MRTRFVVIGTAVALGFIACGDDNGPSSPAGPSVFMGPPKSLQITGNLNLTAVGQTSQLTATATFVSGETKNVTPQAKWEVTNSSVATITERGLLRAVAVGEAQVTASFRGVTSSAVTVKVPPAVTKLVVTGPAQMASGTTEQFTATQQLSDGSTRDVSATASWSTSNSSLLNHLGAGRFEARGAGETTARASADRLSASSQTVLILPPGTFKLSGTVRDAGGELPDATVELVSGTAAPQKKTTFSDGKYAFYGVAGAVRMRVSAIGYDNQETDVTVTSQAVRDFMLTTTKPVVDVSGTWTMRVSAKSGCTSSWPEILRQHEVTAKIAQNVSRLTVKFSGASVQPSFESTGNIIGDNFGLSIYGDFYYYRAYSLLVRPTPTDWVGIYGTITGTASPSVVTGRFSGYFDYYTTPANATFPTGAVRFCPADFELDFRR